MPAKTKRKGWRKRNATKPSDKDNILRPINILAKDEGE